jgi:hypothetical protein
MGAEVTDSAVAFDKSLDCDNCEPFSERDFLIFVMAGESVEMERFRFSFSSLELSAMERFRFSFSSLELSSPESSGVLKMP